VRGSWGRRCGTAGFDDSCSAACKEAGRVVGLMQAGGLLNQRGEQRLMVGLVGWQVVRAGQGCAGLSNRAARPRMPREVFIERPLVCFISSGRR
jgi:hypothetical protein